jgi:predicted short-subunit dehydrogenase-like oxidoreductase (DUF2520 family)
VGKIINTVNIIGAGLVGKTIAHLICNAKIAKIGSVLCTSISHAEQAVKFIDSGEAVDRIQQLSPADITFITVPDDLILNVSHEIAESNKFKKGSIIVYCSSMVSMDSIKAVVPRDCSLCKVHPIKHIRSAEDAVVSFNGTICVYEGDDAIYPLISNFFSILGAQIYRIKSSKDFLYHAACVLASTYHQVLLSASALLYEDCGLSKVEAISLSRHLALSSLQSLDLTADYKSFIVGPISRGEKDIVEKDIGSIINEDIKRIYTSLGSLAENIISS